MLSLSHVTVTTDDTTIIHDLSYDLLPGKIYAIMGMNGSGKSTLAKAIMGDPSLSITKGMISLDDQDITDLSPDKRARMGIFLAPQSPLAISGVTIQQLLRAAIPREKCKSRDLLTKITETSKSLAIKDDLLTRSLNENFSGGERKKMEMLQATIIDPRYVILDEIDTGVDVDALKVIAAQIIHMRSSDPQRTFIIITHYNRILSHLPVDEVLIMRDGTIIRHGDATLAVEIEKNGYTS